jgi:hypothetical protein
MKLKGWKLPLKKSNKLEEVLVNNKIAYSKKDGVLGEVMFFSVVKRKVAKIVMFGNSVSVEFVLNNGDMLKFENIKEFEAWLKNGTL